MRPIRTRRRPRRQAFTLIELVVSAGSAAVLMAGMASALYISGKSLTPDASASADNNRAGWVLSQITDDVRHALRFTERTATAITFETPDRNGDATPETIRYSWAGTAGDPLLYQVNGGAETTLIANVQRFSLRSLTRTIPATSLGPPTVHYVIYEAFAEAKAATDVTSLVVPIPAGSTTDKLLIAAVAVDGGAAPTMTAAAGWTPLVTVSNGANCGLALWWRIGDGTELGSYSFTWTGAEQAYGWIMRFAEINPAGPINVTNTAVGTGGTAQCPTLTTTVDNTMILRLGGFDDDDITVDSAGMTAHTTITMDKSAVSTTSSTSGGAAYAALAAAGSSGTANFTLTASEEYATVTVAIAPLPPD